MTGGTGVLTRSRKIRYVQGRATITSPTSVSVALTAGGRRVDQLRRRHPGDRLTAATLPNCRSAPTRVLDSTTALRDEERAEALLVSAAG